MIPPISKYVRIRQHLDKIFPKIASQFIAIEHFHKYHSCVQKMRKVLLPGKISLERPPWPRLSDRGESFVEHRTEHRMRASAANQRRLVYHHLEFST